MNQVGRGADSLTSLEVPSAISRHRRSDHRRWSTTGVWHKEFVHLSADADNDYAMIDSTIVRAHQHAAGAKGGTGKRSASDGPKAD